MRKGIVVLFVIMGLSCFGSNPDSLFASGNKSYEQGDFEASKKAYLRLVEEGLSSAEVFYNLGNAYYKTGQLGYSVLYYKKALSRDADHQKALENLEFVEAKLVDQISVLPDPVFTRIMKAGLAVGSMQGWWIAGSGLGVLSLIWLWVFFKRRSPLWFGLALLTIAFSVGMFLFTLQLSKFESTQNYGVVVAASSYLKHAPGQEREDAFVLHEGVVLKIVSQSSGWIEVLATDGKRGWIREEDFRAI